MSSKKLFSKLLAKVLLVPVGISCFEYCTCAMEKKKMTTKQSIMSEVEGEGEEESFERITLELIDEAVQKVIKEKFSSSGFVSFKEFILNLNVDDCFRKDVIAFIDTHRLELTGGHDNFAVAAINHLNRQYSICLLKETIEDNFYDWLDLC